MGKEWRIEEVDFDTARFKAADVNKDGILDETETLAFWFPDAHPEVLTETAKKTFRRRDNNADGKIDLQEYSPVHGGGNIPESVKADFGAADKNGDGSLSLAELTEAESGRVHQETVYADLVMLVDSDKDGFITALELAEALQSDGSLHEHYLSNH